MYLVAENIMHVCKYRKINWLLDHDTDFYINFNDFTPAFNISKADFLKIIWM